MDVESQRFLFSRRDIIGKFIVVKEIVYCQKRKSSWTSTRL